MTTAVQNPLVEVLNRLPLLEPAQMEELPRIQSDFPMPRALAKELIRREWLTSFQANQVFLGHADDLIVGQYLCLNKIGEGGMGQVFKARKRPLDRVVALKVLRRECLENARTVQRFQREMRAVGQLQHPHIIRANDADEADGLHYIAMEYIEGIDLAGMVKRNGPLEIEPALDYIRQAALGLQHAHDSGLVHRDIKPANLLVAKDKSPNPPRSSWQFRWGMVKILDLGLARLADPREAKLTVLGTVMGTPDFIAPEQAINPHTCDARADLYSLGCTLYFLLTGRIPFPRGGVTDKILQHQTQEPEPLAAVRRARLMHDAARCGTQPSAEMFPIRAEVEAIVQKLMAKRPADRFQTPAELAHVLGGILTGLGFDPVVIVPTRARANPNMTPLPAALTMPMREFLAKRPPSAPWCAMVKDSQPDAIVKIRVPVAENRSATRWWAIGAAVVIILSSLLFVQANRALKSQVDDAAANVEASGRQ